MDINKIFIGLLGILFAYGTYFYWTQPLPPVMNSVTPWGQQVGRSKSIQSKTGDASLFIQKSRRNATKNGGYGPNFMEATIDYHFITRVCPITCLCCNTVEGGGAEMNTLLSYGGGGADEQNPRAIDGGNA